MDVQIIHNAAILPFGGESVLSDGAIAWDAKGILDIGRSEGILKKYHDHKSIDAGGRIVTPGLINLHSHFYSILARGLRSPGSAPANFPQILESFWWRWDKCLDLKAVGLSAELGLLGSLACGVTAVFDHHSSPTAVRGSLDTIAEAYRKIGLRGSLCYEVSDRDGADIARQGIEENAAFADSLTDDNGGKLIAHFGLHANFTLSDDTLRALGKRLAGQDIGIHIHMAEDDSDNRAAMSAGYRGPVERLERFGLLNDKALLIHGVHLASDQWDIVRKYKANVIHNPASNLNNAVGIAPVGEMIDRALSVGLGTDGYGLDMLTSLNLAQLAAKSRAGDPRAGNWAVSLLTEANPRIASMMLGRETGILKPGAAVDMVLWDYYPSTPVSNDSAASHLLFGVQYAKPMDIWIEGEKVWESGRSNRVDESRIAGEAKARVPELWKRFLDSDTSTHVIR